MILVFGGAYQGKSDFVTETFDLTKADFFDCLTTIDFSYKVLNNLDKYILHLVKNNIDPMNYIQSNLDKFQDKIIIMTDISSGVVPICPTMRKWREHTGQCMFILSKKSDAVFRMFCGIATKVK